MSAVPTVPAEARMSSYAGSVRPWVGTVARWVLGGALLVAGLLKLTDLDGSVRSVQAYDLLPVGLTAVVGYVLPAAELALGALLVAGLVTRWAAGMAGLLMLLFVAGIASAWARGLAIDCGCFGRGGQVAADRTRYLQDILRDGGLLACAAFLVLWPRTRLSLDARTDPPAAELDDVNHDVAPGDWPGGDRPRRGGERG